LSGLNSFQEFDPVRAFIAGGAVKAACYCDSPQDVPSVLTELFCKA